MEIKKKIEKPGECILYPMGRIDYSTANILREEIASVPDDVERIVLDFRDVLYISSSGLRELMICRRKYTGDNMLIRNISESVMEIFTMTGFDTIIPLQKMEMDVSNYINMSFSELLEHRAVNSKNLVVLMSESAKYTWYDIEQSSQIIAEDLQKLGAGKGSHIGICATNSVNWILTFYAIQKLGAMAMLINPVLSPEEIGRVCAIGDVSIFCYGDLRGAENDENFSAKLNAGSDGRNLILYSISKSIDYRTRFFEYELIKDKFSVHSDPDSPCVVIFTSGSTGKPKGVILSSFNLLNAAAVQVKLQKMTGDDIELLMVPLFHILGLVVCLFPCAMAGVPLFVPEDIHSGTIIRLMREHRFTLLHCVPTMILAVMNNQEFDKEAFSSLRCTLFAGAASGEVMLEKCRENMPNNHFITAYGLSEMAPVSQTLYEDTAEHLTGTVGLPVDNIEIKVVNTMTGEECAAGESGEVLVRGFNLMTGYYKIPIEEQAIDEDGWLHTGDMGCLGSDGYLSFLGRYKELIIRGGENIMPLEVENAIAQLPMIEEVKVVGVPSDFYGEEAAACIIIKDGEKWDEEYARKVLEGALAKYKIPSYFIVFEEFKKLGSGKLDAVAIKNEAIKRLPD